MTNKDFIRDTQGLIDFIAGSASCYHVTENIKQTLLNEDYTELFESREWEIRTGGKYFVTRNRSSIIAFKVPEEDFTGFMICASHSDSPAFKIKPNPEMEAEDAYVKLNIEKYGGMILSSWLDRPLSIAGRIIIETAHGIETKLVNIDRDLCVIPNLAIHMQHDMNNGSAWNVQKDMLPLIGNIAAKGRFMDTVAGSAGVDADDVIGCDLFLYNRQKGIIWGLNNEYYSTPKIDDLQCAYASTQAMLKAENPKMMPVLAVFDNEEVGSGTKQGAKSTFLLNTLERANAALNRTSVQFMQAAASSVMLSADNGHAVHPNQPDKACPTNRPKMNGGVVIKYNANQKYTTDGIAEALLKKILNKHKIPYQTYANRSDIPGGSTLGNLSNEKISLNTVDIGMAQLAMHSCYETGGTKDTTYLIDAITAFYSTVIADIGNGSYIIE